MRSSAAAASAASLKRADPLRLCPAFYDTAVCVPHLSGQCDLDHFRTRLLKSCYAFAEAGHCAATGQVLHSPISRFYFLAVDSGSLLHC